MDERRCIYCPNPAVGENADGDHVVPAAFGRFEGEFLFRQICARCNSVLGRCEEQLTRCAPEAYLRRLVAGPVIRGKRGQSWTGAHGIAPPKFTVKQAGHHEQVEFEPGSPPVMRPFDQLVVFNRERKEFHIRLIPTMTAEHLRRKLEALEVTPSGDCYLHADSHVAQHYLSLIRELWPDVPVESTGETEAGPHPVHTVTTFTFHVDYFRAIAKIGFHYYLLHSRRGLTGTEPTFASLRRYLLEGGDHRPFFVRSRAGIRAPFGELPGGAGPFPPQWMHILGANEEGSRIVATVSLYMGPKHLAQVHNILLGTAPERLVVPGACYAHAYEYHDNQGEGTHAGRVVDLPLSLIA